MNAANQRAIEEKALATLDRIDSLADDIRFWVEEAFPDHPIAASEAASELKGFSSTALNTYYEEGLRAFATQVAFAGPGIIARGEAAVETWKDLAAEIGKEDEA